VGENPLPSERRGAGKARLIAHVASRELKMLACALAFGPDVLVGTDIVITHVAKLLNRKSLVLNEDDASEVPLLARYGFRYATALLAPACCDQSPFNGKKIGYRGYHELAYLHPRHFLPDRARVAHLGGAGRYFLLRFSALSAHHDGGRRGIDSALAERLIGVLEGHGAVYVTSERPLDDALEPYRVPIHPRDIHHALAFADGYVGDSQTMAAEAAVLGTPSLRYNDFVGRLSYLEELEHEYGLTIGIRTSEPSRLLALAATMAADRELKTAHAARRDRMLSETVDVAAFFVHQILAFSAMTRAGTVHPAFPIPARD
jgi:predicted glycosyltransferase